MGWKPLALAGSDKRLFLKIYYKNYFCSKK
jgi:hypothetical protein